MVFLGANAFAALSRVRFMLLSSVQVESKLDKIMGDKVCHAPAPFEFSSFLITAEKVKFCNFNLNVGCQK